MDMRPSALPAKNTDARDARDDRIIGGGDANGWRVPDGRHCRHGRKVRFLRHESSVRFSMRRIILHAMPTIMPTPLHDCMPLRMTVACDEGIWMRLDDSMRDVFMISPLNAMQLPVRVRTLTGIAIRTGHESSSHHRRSKTQKKQKSWVRYDMFANVHG